MPLLLSADFYQNILRLKSLAISFNGGFPIGDLLFITVNLILVCTAKNNFFFLCVGTLKNYY